VTLCGELASKPIGALALVAIGYRSLSLSPSAVGPVKAMLLDLNARKAAALIQPLIDSPAGSLPIRERLKAFAAEEGLQL
jgi:phosphotransferase system enzyme I (PtsP)